MPAATARRFPGRERHDESRRRASTHACRASRTWPCLVVLDDPRSSSRRAGSGIMLACNAQWHELHRGTHESAARSRRRGAHRASRMAETSKVTAVAQHRLDDAKVNEVMTSLGAKAKRRGDGGPLATTRAGARWRSVLHADRAERIAFTHPRKVIIITPPEGFDQLRDQTEPAASPAGRGRPMSLTLVRPVATALARSAATTRDHHRNALNAVGLPRRGVNAAIEFDDQDVAAGQGARLGHLRAGAALGADSS